MNNSGTPLHKFPRHVQDQIAAQLYPGLTKVRKNQEAIVDEIIINAAVSSPYPLNLWLDYRVPSLNRLLGRVRVTIAEKGKAKEAVNAALAVVRDYPRAPGRMHVVFTCYVCQPRDADNPVTKFVNDALRYAGVLLTDDRAGMVLTVNPDVKVSTRKEEGTKVVIVPALL